MPLPTALSSSSWRLSQHLLSSFQGAQTEFSNTLRSSNHRSTSKEPNYVQGQEVV